MGTAVNSKFRWKNRHTRFYRTWSLFTHLSYMFFLPEVNWQRTKRSMQQWKAMTQIKCTVNWCFDDFHLNCRIAQCSRGSGDEQSHRSQLGLLVNCVEQIGLIPIVNVQDLEHVWPWGSGQLLEIVSHARSNPNQLVLDKTGYSRFQNRRKIVHVTST